MPVLLATMAQTARKHAPASVQSTAFAAAVVSVSEVRKGVEHVFAAQVFRGPFAKRPAPSRTGFDAADMASVTQQLEFACATPTMEPPIAPSRAQASGMHLACVAALVFVAK